MVQGWKWDPHALCGVLPSALGIVQVCWCVQLGPKLLDLGGDTEPRVVKSNPAACSERLAELGYTSSAMLADLLRLRAIATSATPSIHATAAAAGMFALATSIIKAK